MKRWNFLISPLRFARRNDNAAATPAPSHRAVRHSRPRRPAEWYLSAFHSLIILTKILRFVETLQRVSKSAEVGPRRTMVSFIGMLTLVHPFATTWHFAPVGSMSLDSRVAGLPYESSSFATSRGNEKFRGAFRLSADRPRMTLEGEALRSRSSIPRHQAPSIPPP